jgi:integrase/recombinase XerD
MELYKPAKIHDHDGDLTKRWYIYYSFLDPDTGKYQQFQKFISLREKTKTDRYVAAKKLKDAINKRLREGFNPFAGNDPGHTNIIEAFAYIEKINATKRKRTQDTYSCLIRRFKEFLNDKRYHLSTLTIEEFNYVHAQKFMDYYLEERKVENRTYNYALMHMRSFFTVLMEREWVNVNPFKKIKMLPVEETSIVAFSEEDLKKLRENLPTYNYDLYIVAGLIYYCFLRPAELMRLRVQDFHVEQGYLSIPAHVSKNKKQTTIDIPSNFLIDLAQFDLNYPEEYFVFARHLKRGPKEAAPTRIAGYWRTFADEFGIDKNIYALKHTGNGRASEAGITPRDLQLHNRHHSLDMTQKYLDRFSKRTTTTVVTTFPKM